MFCDFDGEFCLADSGCADNGDEFFHAVNFLFFFELDSNIKVLKKIKIGNKINFSLMTLNSLMFKIIVSKSYSLTQIPRSPQMVVYGEIENYLF